MSGSKIVINLFFKCTKSECMNLSKSIENNTKVVKQIEKSLMIYTKNAHNECKNNNNNNNNNINNLCHTKSDLVNIVY